MAKLVCIVEDVDEEVFGALEIQGGQAKGVDLKNHNFSLSSFTLAGLSDTLKDISRLHFQDDFENTNFLWKRTEKFFKKISKFLFTELSSEEIASSLATFSECSMSAWVDSGTDVYFELEANFLPNIFDSIIAVAMRDFRNSMEMNLIYMNKTFYICLSEVTNEVAHFLDRFPSISNRGPGLQVKTYDEEEEEGCPFGSGKLMLWANVESQQALLKDLKLNSLVIEKPKLKFETEDVELDEIEIVLAAENSFQGSYTQTYLVSDKLELVDSQDGSSESIRSALFRFGEWIYEGTVTLEKHFSLNEVPLLLRTFQRQQGKLKFSHETKNLPFNHRFQVPMGSLVVVSSFLKDYILKSEKVLQKLEDLQKQRNMNPWVDVESGKQYFELQVTRSYLKDHFDNVGFLATKIYFHEVVFIVIYMKGFDSFFVTLNAAKGDQPLLDLSFPDVSSKNRGYLLFSFKHKSFKKLMIWECQKSVWETSNNLVLEQRAKLSEDKKQMKEEAKSECKEDIVEIKPEGNKREHITTTKPEKHDEEKEEKESEKKYDIPTVKAPHRVKPMERNMKTKALESLPRMESEAPWDDFGRPRLLQKKESKRNE